MANLPIFTKMYRPHVWCCICPNPAIAEVLAEKTGYRNTQKKKRTTARKNILGMPTTSELHLP